MISPALYPLVKATLSTVVDEVATTDDAASAAATIVNRAGPSWARG